MQNEFDGNKGLAASCRETDDDILLLRFFEQELLLSEIKKLINFYCFFVDVHLICHT